MLRFHDHRIRGRKSPALTSMCQRIGWRADLGAEAITGLIDPGLRARRVGAYRVVAVQPDGHAEVACQRLRSAELLVRQPLKIQVELDLARVLGREALGGACMRIMKLRRPVEPARMRALRRAQLSVERAEARVQLQQLSALRHEPAKRGGTLRAAGEMTLLKLAEQQAQDLELDVGDAG